MPNRQKKQIKFNKLAGLVLLKPNINLIRKFQKAKKKITDVQINNTYQKQKYLELQLNLAIKEVQ